MTCIGSGPSASQIKEVS
nr:unnamed protein product [Callosobruchus analis]